MEILYLHAKNDRLRNLCWLVSETRMHQLPENLFLLSLRQDNFSNYVKKFFESNSRFYLSKIYLSTLTTLVMAFFGDAYAPTSRKYISTEPNARSLQ